MTRSLIFDRLRLLYCLYYITCHSVTQPIRCVKTKRLDVAEVCLGNMGHARGAAAVRVAKKEPELDACIAMVAVQLGLMDDAIRLYKECGRYDLLNRLFQAAGLWERAIEIAKEHDRIHLRTTYFNYAKYLEEHGQIPAAVKNYENANAHRKEVPRIYFGEHRVDELEEYVMRSNDSQLLRWWAQFSESNGEFDKAKNFYEKAGDYLNLVRIHCYNQEFDQAQTIVQKSNDKASAYHLARQHEAIGREQEAVSSIQTAIQLYEKADQYNHAIRLAKEYQLDAELMQYALHSDDNLKIECANYFEQKRDFSKAVQLYQKVVWRVRVKSIVSILVVVGRIGMQYIPIDFCCHAFIFQ
jgi:intraflagellar transport protein 140